MSRWQRYWFADGGRLAAAVVRIAIATSVLLSLAKLASPVSTGDLPGTHTLYHPVGVWMVLDHIPPPAIVVGALWVLAWAATAAMLVGFQARASTAVSFGASVALASLSYAASRTWQHQYNIVFLAQLAFLGARCGDTLSVDAVIRRLRGRPPISVARGYQWSLRLVQLAVALMFAGAAFHKLLHGHGTLRWALSDNLRNQLLVAFDLAGLERPALADWMIDDPWRYRSAAMLNLVSQAVPLAACFLVRRPILRAVAGSLFVVETLALGYVIDLWNLHWLPLYAVFVDWDWLLRRPAPPPIEVPPRRATRLFIAGFVAYDALTSFAPGIAQVVNTYPFSNFPMFAVVRARPPYDEHLPYSVAAAHFEVTSDPPIDLAIQRWFDHANRSIETVRDPDALRARLGVVLAQARRRYPTFAFRELRLELTLYEAPAYPAPAHLEPHRVAIIGELGDELRTMLGTLDGDRLRIHPRGVDVTGARFVYFRDDEPSPIPLEVRRDGDDYVATGLAGDAIDVVAVTPDGTPWLVASRQSWTWRFEHGP